jgi:hypothetical protein
MIDQCEEDKGLLFFEKASKDIFRPGSWTPISEDRARLGCCRRRMGPLNNQPFSTAKFA